MKLGIRLNRKDKKQKRSARKGAKPKSGSTSLESAFLGLFILLTLLIFIGAAAVYQTLRTDMSSQNQNNDKAVFSSYAKQVHQSIDHYTSILKQMASEPQLIKALQENNTAQVAQREAQLAYLLPTALRVRILPADFDQPDRSVNPPISYACLDMISTAAQGGQSAIEAHLAGKPDQHIDIAQGIRSGSTSLGTILATLPVQVLKQELNRLDALGGLIELQQSIPNGGLVTLARRGNPELKSGRPAHKAPIKDTLWHIAYWPQQAGNAMGQTNTLMYWGVVAVIWLIFSLLLYLTYRRLLKALLNDQVMVIKLMKDISYGEMSSSYPIALRNCHGAMEQMRMIAGEMTGLRTRQSRSGGRPAGDNASAGNKINVNEDLAYTPNADALEVHEINGDSASGMTTGSGKVPASIFRAYDIRGIYNETLTPEIVEQIGRALGSEAQERGQHKIVVARDGRLSGPELSQALMRGLQQSGREVIDIGRVPTPVLYFASHYLGNGSGVMLTGSHNPANYNGLKMMLRGETLHGDSITALRTRIETDNLVSGEGSVQTVDVVPSYVERVTSDVRLQRPLKIVIDCGNGVAGELAPQLYRALGCEVIEMFCDVDGNFPNHHPDPSKPENLIQLTRAVTEQGADIGLAFDGDGDRLGIIDSAGKVIWPDRYLMLMAIDVLTRQPGAQIIYDVKCTTHLKDIISSHGGQPLMWKTGHSFIKSKMQETGAQLAGEMSGHIFFKERWLGFDDALYAGARLLEIISGENTTSSDQFAALPESVSTPELNVHLQEGEHFELMEKLKANANFPGAQLIDIDGLRMEFGDGWGLVRASNTTPSLVIRFEANDAAALGRIQDTIRTQLLSIHPDLDLPF